MILVNGVNLGYKNYHEFRSGAGVERMGLGSSKPGEVGEDDDEFDQYRKRMMLAYRFRPNPMVCSSLPTQYIQCCALY